MRDTAVVFLIFMPLPRSQRLPHHQAPLAFGNNVFYNKPVKFQPKINNHEP